MAGFAERFREEGMLVGERALLERQLRRRFGLLNPELIQKLELASAAELERWAENVLDAGSLDEVFNE